MIKVLIVEDSRVAQEFLTYVLTTDPNIQIVGIVSDGTEAVQAVQEKRPDVVTMDIHMPKMDGYEATQAIMETAPTPIVIVSASTGAKEAQATFRALNAGALAVVLRPPGIGHPAHSVAAKELIWTVKTMSEIKVVRRFNHVPRNQPPTLPYAPGVLPVATRTLNVPAANLIQAIAIGASTGGPPVLHKILSLLPADLPVPLFIVQHISSGFVGGFVSWLSEAAHFPVHVAVHGQYPLAGHAYVAPDNMHMGIAKGLRIVLSNHAPENGLRPSVSHLFRSVTQVLAAGAIGVILTGMGRDGAQELKELKESGAITIAQDEASSIVHGMPGEAIKLGGAIFVLSPEAIAATLSDLVQQSYRRVG